MTDVTGQVTDDLISLINNRIKCFQGREIDRERRRRGSSKGRKEKDGKRRKDGQIRKKTL